MTDTYDLDIMARTLYGEAQVNNEADAKAIACVIMNRVRFRQWPDSPAAVCKQKWQFSCWWDDKALARMNAAKGQWFEVCKRIARDAIAGRLEDVTSASTHYYATYIKAPAWAKGKKPVYAPKGSPHVFFNDIDRKPPQTAKEALDQKRPIAKSKIIQGGAAVGTLGGGLAADGITRTLEAVSPAVPIASTLADTAPYVLLGLVIMAVAGWIIWSRLKMRRDGEA